MPKDKDIYVDYSTNLSPDYVFYKSFLRAAGKKEKDVTPEEEQYFWRLVGLVLPSYDATMNPTDIRKALREARKTGKKVRVVRDREFWKNGTRYGQCDGWSYHLELYTPRKKNSLCSKTK